MKHLIIMLAITCSGYPFSGDAFKNQFFDLKLLFSKAEIGDTVHIPPGEFELDGLITVKAGVTIMGAGRNKTTLKRAHSVRDWFIKVDCSNGLPVRISGMTIRGVSPGNSPGIKLVNNPANFRIHGMTFIRCKGRAIEIHGNSNGVIYNCTFIDNSPTAVVVFGDGSEAWKRPLSLGSDQAVFVEDCYFEQKSVPDSTLAHHIASNNGSRYVFRYNKCKDGNIRSSAVDAHGNKHYWERGSRSYEVYNNHFMGERRWAGLNLRGGDGVVFNNVFCGKFMHPIHLLYEEKPENRCKSYPCLDQIRQLHIWNNTYNKKSFEIKVRHPEIIRQDQDYYLSPLDGYVPYDYPHPLRNDPEG